MSNQDLVNAFASQLAGKLRELNVGKFVHPVNGFFVWANRVVSTGALQGVLEEAAAASDLALDFQDGWGDGALAANINRGDDPVGFLALSNYAKQFPGKIIITIEALYCQRGEKDE